MASRRWLPCPLDRSYRAKNMPPSTPKALPVIKLGSREMVSHSWTGYLIYYSIMSLEIPCEKSGSLEAISLEMFFDADHQNPWHRWYAHPWGIQKFKKWCQLKADPLEPIWKPSQMWTWPTIWETCSRTSLACIRNHIRFLPPEWEIILAGIKCNISLFLVISLSLPKPLPLCDPSYLHSCSWTFFHKRAGEGERGKNTSIHALYLDNKQDKQRM